MLAGGGVHISGAADVLTNFARAYEIPVAHTMTGKGAIACTDPLSAGLFGRYDRIANALIEEADCLLVVGCKLGEIATKRYTVPPKGKTLIHLDIVAEEFGRTTKPDIALWGDARAGIEDLHEAMRGSRPARGEYAKEVARRMGEWRESVAERYTSEEVPVSMGRLMGELNRLMPADGILVADGGFAAHWGGLLYDTKQAGRGFVPDRGFASIGYGLPGAIGAALAGRRASREPHRRRRLQHDARRARDRAAHGARFRDHHRQQRRLRLCEGAAAPHVWRGRLSRFRPRRDQLREGGEALGCTGIRVEEPGAVGPALEQAFRTQGPVVIDVVVTRDPAKMLPAVDNRTVQVRKGDRVA